MEQLALPVLARWESFYVIVGSSAGALTGLQFVVIALGVETKAIKGPAIRAFATPTIVHFCAILLMSAIFGALCQALSQLGIAVMAVCVPGFRHRLMLVRAT